ncbi:carboxylic ester hydrolase [Parastagonospora nodorum]|nr:carboxylic ester hydrolase [Parastagonospora nodorum]KAH4126294.1 carboxylic ester hydrolase [Parastagonospora nodorum]KAH4402936.1 carboxylic ester hydrolase [Parastagonospora nodorum]KAH4416522.1 carboxylic ester hydrolase [Parastagonospora nodorum]KAH4432921.1 carboxylic ester hydrolase [Parastagonospora nodorum]
MPPITLYHPTLGPLKCLYSPSTSLLSIHGLPYATIPQRFARSQLCTNPSSHPIAQKRTQENVFDATYPGPSSIQPFGSVTSDASNIPLPTDDMPADEEQDEDCLTLSIHMTFTPSHTSFNAAANLPVLAFIHGGAYFLGSGNRPYYSPTSFLSHATSTSQPLIFVSINYRLGALGFLHTRTSTNIVPENNGLHDQILALRWVQEFIGGFGGDKENVMVMGQSAGAESTALLSHSSFVKEEGLFNKGIVMSGSQVTMPAMTPDEHAQNFLRQADKLGILTENRDVDDIAQDVIAVDVGKIRELAWVGSPCTMSALLPFERPTMQGKWNGGSGVEKQVISTTTYDGGISFNMMSRDESRSNHAASFTAIATDVLGRERAARLCDIYEVYDNTPDPEALQKICLFESDTGFFFAALHLCTSSPTTYFQIFDLPNPFPGPLSSQGHFATHTFDITTLLGGYDESSLPEGYGEVISNWRDKILAFVRDGAGICEEFGEEGKGLIVGSEGVREVDREGYMAGRRQRLSDLADEIDEKDGWDGWDVLWVDVCRRFLMKGE